MDTNFILTLSCEDKPGIVAAVAQALAESGGNINEAQQFDAPQSALFFMRVAFTMDDAGAGAFEARFAPIAERYGMTWELFPKSRRRKVLILVSKFDHCLIDLLYRNRIGELEMDVVGIVSNHPKESINAAMIGDDIPYHYFPVAKGEKAAQEAEIKRVVNETGASSSCSRATCRSCPMTWQVSCRGVASTSTTASCPASRAPNRITRRIRAA